MHEDERGQLIERLRRYGYVTDRKVLEAMGSVPREEFLPADQRRLAYQDTPLSIGKGQTISAPHMVGMMLDALELRPGMKVLEIGTGSGYHASLMGYLVRPNGRVYTVERIEELGTSARGTLERLGFGDVVEVVIADGTEGLKEHAPYDRILVTAAAPSVPQPLKEQLADGGRLLLPLGTRAMQELVMVTRHGDEYRRQELGGVMFVPLIGKHGYRD
ncbi:protein-L-isoaspartate O-methyltransferase [Methanomassiliicoccus luminyensis]|uniref:protein-L-isoaspartate O-methyltransferase n=1 Tax=Methanomassiliicoccus luminyensis TaxID=1080712 RepID=UPI00036F7CFC|nr:protein-L-isoaspartate O-methyltransferase [Methanomassiliicoccus luminyensis]